VPPTAFVALLPSLLVPALLVAYPKSLWPAVVLYHAYCVIASFLYEDAHDPRPLYLRLSIPQWPPIAAAVAIGALGELIAWGVVDVRGWLPAGSRELVATTTPWRWFAVYAVLANGYFEERFWRGALMSRTGIVAGAAAFGLMHGLGAGVRLGAVAGIVSGVAALAAGLAWGGLRDRYGSLWPCVITHMAVDAALVRVASALLVP
jgi:membrane protease YdiL (CAAX protease family)